MGSVLIKFEFWALILCSTVVPIGIYCFLLVKKIISRISVILFGLFLVALSAGDIIILKLLKAIATSTPSLGADLFFNSEFSLALYLLPLLSASIGCNLISHVLVMHLKIAERSYEKQHPTP